MLVLKQATKTENRSTKVNPWKASSNLSYLHANGLVPEDQGLPADYYKSLEKTELEKATQAIRFTEDIKPKSFLFTYNQEEVFVELSGREKTPFYKEKKGPKDGWTHTQIPQVSVNSTSDSSLYDLPIEEALYFRPDEEDNPTQVLRASERKYWDNIATGLSAWSRMEGNSQRIYDFLSNTSLYSIEGVGTQTLEDTIVDETQYIFPWIDNGVVKYSDGRTIYSIQCDSDATAQFLSDAINHIRWNEYVENIRTLTKDERSDKAIQFITPENEVIAVYDHGHDATLQFEGNYTDNLTLTDAMEQAERLMQEKARQRTSGLVEELKQVA